MEAKINGISITGTPDEIYTLVFNKPMSRKGRPKGSKNKKHKGI